MTKKAKANEADLWHACQAAAANGKIADLRIMVTVQGFELTPQEKEILEHPNILGVILFSKNYFSFKQLNELVNQIRCIRKPFLIAVDQEGGRVQRFTKGFTPLPALGELGLVYKKKPTQARKDAYHYATVMAQELCQVDIDFSFAPVLDIDYGMNTVIGSRSFGRDINAIIDLGQAYISGLSAVGMPAIGKHFPGHGCVSGDTHVTDALDTRDYTEIYNADMQPFIQLLSKLAGIMPSHVHVS